MQDNIIVFLSDQQRYDTLGCNGQSLPITPNLDQLALEGINYKCAFTPQPVCGPARACLQTGLYPTQVGCYRNAISMPIDQNTIAKELKKVGYDVAYVGKWHLASDEFDNHYETSAVPMERRGGYDDYWMASDVLEFTSHGYDGYIFDKKGEKVEFKGYRADCITDYAVDYIKNNNGEKPFFLFVSHIEPHHQNDRNAYEGPSNSKEKFLNYERPKDLPTGKGDWEQYMPDYLGCCNALDKNLGKIIDALKNKNIYDNTTIIYTSDHGCHFKTVEECVENGYDDYKRNAFENTIHIPMIIKGNDFKKGKIEDKLVSLIDLPRTILELAKVDISEEIQGYSLLNDNEEKKRNYVYIQISESYVGRAIRTERYKYVVWSPDKNPWTEYNSSCYQEKYLFDIENDCLEKNNLIYDSNYYDIKKQLCKMLIEGAEVAGEGRIVVI
ncbi:MAG: sulfatase-like hydrolase/transferase [Eubacteriales bacterium]